MTVQEYAAQLEQETYIRVRALQRTVIDKELDRLNSVDDLLSHEAEVAAVCRMAADTFDCLDPTHRAARNLNRRMNQLARGRLTLGKGRR